MFHAIGICAALCTSAALSPAVTRVRPLPAEPVRRALLVGIDDYPPENRWPKLSGPRLDVAALRTVLIERAGFRSEHIRTLLDGEATADAIRGGFGEMVEAAQSGDLVLFYFAGHGSRVPDDSGSLEERDRWDETLVPYDASAGDGPCKDIRDEEIGRWIEQANAKTDQVVLIFDCCSSGTNTRAETPAGRRFLEPTKRGFGAARTSAFAPALGGSVSGYVPPALKYVALAACRADQSAYEIQLDAPEGSGGKISRGVFSYHLVDALRSLPAGASYTDLMIQVAGRVSRAQAEQTPILEGCLAGYVLFEPVAASHTPRFPAEVDAKEALTVAGGRLHGLAKGDVFGICGDDALRDNLPSRLGRARLVRVGTMTSTAEWIESIEGGRAAGKRSAFLLERSAAHASMRLAIDASGGDAPPETIVRALESKGIRCVASQDAGAFALRRNGARWTLFAPDATLLPIAADEASEREVAALVEDLGRLATAERVDKLLRHDGASPLALEVSLRRVSEDNRWLDPITPGEDGRITIAPEERWAVCVKNSSKASVFVHVVTISPDGDIDVPYPPTLDDAVYPGQDSPSPPLSIEAVKPDYAAFYRSGPIRLHCIATQRPLDLASLKQAPVTLGKSTRGVAERPALAEDALVSDAWFAARIEIWVSP